MRKPSKNKKSPPPKQKNKLKSLVSRDDLVQKRFQDVITRLQGKTALTAQDRYCFGCALVKKNKGIKR